MARLLLGVSGGIAAYKALEFVRLATEAGHRVRVIQSPRSERFVGRASFQALTGAPVLGDEFESDPLRGAYPGEPAPERTPISHLALVARAELYVIAPASANTLAKLAHGHADNLLCTAALAADCPVLVAPAMNDRMFRHPATSANLETAGRARGAGHPAGRGAARLARRARGRAPGRAERAAGRLRGGAGSLGATPLGLDRAPRARHRGRHARADRQRALHRQPLLGAHGLCPGSARGRAGSTGHRSGGQRRAP